MSTKRLCRSFSLLLLRTNAGKRRSTFSEQVLPACGIGSVNYRFALFAYQRLLRYEIIPTGESLRIAATRPWSIEAERVRTMFRRLAGFPTYAPAKTNRVLIQGNINMNERLRQDPYDLIKPFTLVSYDRDQLAEDCITSNTGVDEEAQCLI